MTLFDDYDAYIIGFREKRVRFDFIRSPDGGVLLVLKTPDITLEAKKIIKPG